MPVLFAVYLVAAVGEEAGWMGYAADPLRRRHGSLTAALIIGGLLAVWHIPAFFQAGRDPTWIIWQALFLIAARVLAFWLFIGSAGSAAATVVFHASLNLSASVFPQNGSGYDPAVAAPVAAALCLVVLAHGTRWFHTGRPSQR